MPRVGIITIASTNECNKNIWIKNIILNEFSSGSMQKRLSVRSEWKSEYIWNLHELKSHGIRGKVKDYLVEIKMLRDSFKFVILLGMTNSIYLLWIYYE